MLYQHKGIGESKKESRQESDFKGENGQKISTKIHSIKSLKNIRDDLTNLGRFAKENYGMKDMSKIDANIVRDWINDKGISYNTASNYLSEINKMNQHFSITPKDVKELRVHFKQELRPNELQHRAYKGLEKIQLPKQFQPAFELQRDYGLRMSAATHINLKDQLQGNFFRFQQKGGRWSEIKLSNALAQKIRDNAVQGRYGVNNDTYSNHLRSEIEKSGQEYNGTHGIRHSFAQHMKELGYSDAEISKMMGHTRTEIVNTYFR